MEIQKLPDRESQIFIAKLQNPCSKGDQKTIQEILDRVRDELYQGISTQEIYNRLCDVKKRKSIFASVQTQKGDFTSWALRFPFERFVAALLEYSGYRGP